MRLTVGYLAMVLWLCIYVPWTHPRHGADRSVGYSFLWSPPGYPASVVDTTRVVLGLVAVTAVFAAACVLVWLRLHRK